MGVVEDTTFFLVTLGLVGAILITPQDENRGRKLITGVSPRAGRLSMAKRALGRAFAGKGVHACTLKVKEKGRHAEDGTWAVCNLGWVN